MSKKRLSIGIMLIVFSIVLAWPKTGIEIFNWGKPTLNVIFAIVPIILIGYGIILSKKHKTAINNYSNNEEQDENDASNQDFRITEEWKSSDNWKANGLDIWQGVIEDNKFKMERNTKMSHYAKKFRYVNVESIEIDLELPEIDDVEAFIELGTGNNRKEINKLDFEKTTKSEKMELENGKNEIKPSINWKDFSFFKIVLHRKNSGMETPSINNVLFKGKKMGDKITGNKKFKEETYEENTERDLENEEMPAFEDVEYKDLECPECGEHFKTDIGLRVHRKVNHPEEFEENPDPYGEGD